MITQITHEDPAAVVAQGMRDFENNSLRERNRHLQSLLRRALPNLQWAATLSTSRACLLDALACDIARAVDGED